MDNVTKPKDQASAAPNGIFVRGVVVSNRAKAIKRKDGTGISVVVETEIATQPGVTIWVQYFDPKTDRFIRLEGETVVEYPRLKEFSQVTIKALRVRSDEHTGQLTIRSGELIP